MVDTFGVALRQLRDGAGLSQKALANRAIVSKSLLGLVELDLRRPTECFATACDAALGTAPLLATLAAMGDEDVRRRSILTHVGQAAAVGAVAGPGGLAEIVRVGLLDAAEVGEDWDAVIHEYRHRITVDSSARFGSSLLAKLMTARQRLTEAGATPELLRAVAALGQVYGLWLGNIGDLAAAHGWYGTAAALAEMSGDRRLTSHVVGRAAARGSYEGWSVRRTMAGADRALELANGRAWEGAQQAFAARVHVHALTGDAAAGRNDTQAMLEIAAKLADPMALASAMTTATFAECRYGTVASAYATYAEGRELLRAHPHWHTEVGVYLGRIMVSEGDVLAGIGVALDALAGRDPGVRVIGVAVRDLVCSVPAGIRDDGLDELRRLADPAPGPWETLR